MTFQTSQKFKIQCTVVGEFIAPLWTSDFVTNSYGESWPGTGLSPKLKMCPDR